MRACLWFGSLLIAAAACGPPDPPRAVSGLAGGWHRPGAMGGRSWGLFPDIVVPGRARATDGELGPHAGARRTIEIAVHWTSLAAEPLALRIAAELRSFDGDAAARCVVAPTGSFEARCTAEAWSAELAALAIALPPELGGAAHPFLLLPLEARERRIDVEMWLAEDNRGVPLVDTIKLDRERRTPRGLTLEHVASETSPYRGYSLVNGTQETVRFGDVWMERMPLHERWQCAGCGNARYAPPPVGPGEERPIVASSHGGLHCKPQYAPKQGNAHRFVVRLIGEPVPVALSSERWPSRPPIATERPVYELSDLVTLP